MNIWPKWARVARSRLSRSARGPISARYSCSIATPRRSEEHTSELQSHSDIVCRLLLEKKKNSNVLIKSTLNKSIDKIMKNFHKRATLEVQVPLNDKIREHSVDYCRSVLSRILILTSC